MIEAELISKAMASLPKEVRDELPKNLNTHKKLTASQKEAISRFKSAMAALKSQPSLGNPQQDLESSALQAAKAAAKAEESLAVKGLVGPKVVGAVGAVTDTAPVTVSGNERPAQTKGRPFLQYLIKLHGGNVPDAFFEYCFVNNEYYDKEFYDGLASSSGSDFADSLPDVYEKAVEEDPARSGKTFLSEINRANFEKVTAQQIDEEVLSDADKQNRAKILKIMSYDPFEKSDIQDRPNLYRKLATIITEQMRNDVPKQSAAVIVVQNYLNLERYQKRLDDLMKLPPDSETQKSIKELTQTLAQMNSSINQTTRENGFTGGRGAVGGDSSLTKVMNAISANHIDDGMTNFEDIKLSKSIQNVSDLSAKALLGELKLQDSDYVDIIADQNKIVREAQKSAGVALEMLRMERAKIKKQELIDELTQEYKEKGMSEEDIESFLRKNYVLATVAASGAKPKDGDAK